LKAMGNVDDGPALTRRVKVKNVATKARVAFIHVGFKGLLVSQYRHGKPSNFTIIKTSIGIIAKFRYRDEIWIVTTHFRPFT